MIKIVFAGGKGGITRSTLARAVAVRLAQKVIPLTAFDLDEEQATFTRWNKRREQLPTATQFPVIPVNNVMALRNRLTKAQGDFAVIDTGAYWAAATTELALLCDVLVLASRYSLDDMDALVRVANAAVAGGVDKNKIIVVFSAVPDSPTEDKDAREYLESLGYYVTPGNIPFTKSASQTQDQGLGLTENRFAGPRTAARLVVDEIIARAYAVAGVEQK